MSVDTRINNTRQTSIATKVAMEVLEEFDRLVPFTDKLKAMRSITLEETLPYTLKRMINAVELTQYEDLNTLAAVAGSFSEYALEIAKKLGSTKTIINNGGDVALFNCEKNSVKVSIPVNNTQNLTIDVSHEQGIGGICTSGLTGRSFSKGIATFVTVFAEKASIADAFATYIANMTNADHPNIIRCLAEEIDEGTDIRGQVITVKASNLPEEIKCKATLSGYEEALLHFNKGNIKGAVICVDDTIMVVPENLKVSLDK